MFQKEKKNTTINKTLYKKYLDKKQPDLHIYRK